VLGLFLGDSQESCVHIMHAYIDQMDFQHTEFIISFRKFLNKFLLPGEAQKIDRLILKFAEKFLKDNPGVFLNAGKK
jgi:brefeldin A-inhibited guanine nucleotide-exchange protein